MNPSSSWAVVSLLAWRRLNSAVRVVVQTWAKHAMPSSFRDATHWLMASGVQSLVVLADVFSCTKGLLDGLDGVDGVDGLDGLDGAANAIEAPNAKTVRIFIFKESIC